MFEPLSLSYSRTDTKIAKITVAKAVNVNPCRPAILGKAEL